MGTYLSTPILDKCYETDIDLESDVDCPVAWGVVDMQGWRKGMEDAHVARTDVVAPAPGYSRKLKDKEQEEKGVDDGGGEDDEAVKEDGRNGEAAADVAAGKSEGNVEEEEDGTSNSDEKGENGIGGDTRENNDAPRESEPTSTTSSRRREAQNAKVFAVFDGHGGPEVARFCQLYLVDVLTNQKCWTGSVGNKEEEEEEERRKFEAGDFDGILEEKGIVDVGKALRGAFHEIDQMINDPNRRDEIAKLRNEKPGPGESRCASDAVICSVPNDVAGSESNGTSDNVAETGDKVEEIVDSPKNEDVSTENDGGMQNDGNSADAAAGKESKEEAEAKTDEEDQNNSSVDADPPDPNKSPESSEDTSDKAESSESSNDSGDNSEEKDGENADGESSGDGVLTADDAMVLFEKLLSITGNRTDDEKEVENDQDKNNTSSSHDDCAVHTTPTPLSTTVTTPTRVLNGRQVCNLPDHPVHAGCTSIVAVIVGRELTVANAGDSRAVLCRAGGVAEGLSIDHKPLQEDEMKRIKDAGGFVNQFGRVNGNLNLSRSIGDLKYKQVAGLSPAHQMITAEPDITEITLHPKDEFIILGCDGIWDCLTNEEAVKFVRDRIDTKATTEIGTEMLDEIVSEDPRASQGIGGDNMTCMIIDLLPHTRSYYNREGDAKEEDENELENNKEEGNENEENEKGDDDNIKED